MIAQSGIPIGINYVAADQDASLFVRSTIQDITAGVPGTLVGTVNLAHILAGSYGSAFVGVAGKTYAVITLVYTDGTYAVIDTNRAPGTFNVECQDLTNVATVTAQIEVKKNIALAGFQFPMFDTTGAPMTGLTVTAQRSIDGAALAACANAPVEIGSGLYKINLAAADLNGSVIALVFSATNARTLFLTIKTQA